MFCLLFRRLVLAFTIVVATVCIALAQPVSAANAPPAKDSEGVLLEEAAIDYRTTPVQKAADSDEQARALRTNTALNIYLLLALVACGYYGVVASKNKN